MSFYDNNPGGDQIDYILDRVPVLRATRQPCVVCGNKSGDCTSGDYGEPKHLITLGKDEELANTDMIEVQEDVFELRQISKTTTGKFLVARKGQQISRKKAAELGII